MGVGWHGGHCFVCDPCRRGDFINCKNKKITGITIDGGYAEYMVIGAEAVGSRAGRTTRQTKPRPCFAPGSRFLTRCEIPRRVPETWWRCKASVDSGHLGVQFARQMGFRTVAIGRGADKESLAKKLGAHHYISTEAGPASEALQKLGGARAVLATAPDSKAMTDLTDGLGPNGQLLIVGADARPLGITPIQLIFGTKALQGWASGTAMDSEDTLQFSALSGVRPMIEKFPLEKVNDAYQRMITGKARFRAVLTMAA